MKKVNLNKGSNKVNQPGRYIYISPPDVGSKAFDLIRHLYDLRDKPDGDSKLYNDDLKYPEINGINNEFVNTYEILGDSILLAAPILLFRIVESCLKQYLLKIYAKNLKDASKYTAKNKEISFKEAILNCKFSRLKELYLDSTYQINIEDLKSYDLIEELRELSNCLKYNQDLVSKYLNKNNKYWVTDSVITVNIINRRMRTYEKGINSFFQALESEVNS